MLAEQRYRQPPSQPAPSPGLLRVPSLYTVAALAIFGAILIVALAPRLDTDLWWHLKVGQYIATHYVVPSRDFMTYSFVGHPWTDHEWLAELMLFGLYRLAGLWGPVIFFALLICSTFALVYANLLQRGINHIVALFVLAAAFMASSASWGPRVQMLTLFFLAAYSLVLFRFEVTRDRRLLAIFPLTMLLWANMHGGFVLGLAIMAITLGGEWLNRVRGRAGAFSPDDLRALGLTLLSTLTVTAINPNGFRQLLYPLTFVLPNAYTNLIQESASPNFHMPVMMVFEGMLLILIAALFVGRRKLNWTHLLMIVAFTHLALSQGRNVALWSVVIAPLLALYVQDALGTSQNRRRLAGGIKSVANVLLLAMVLLVYAGEGHHFVSAKTLRQAESQSYPSGAVAYMRTHPLPSHVLAAYDWGGYLLWNLFPRYRDYMDSRADTLFNAAILHGYLDMLEAKPDWKRMLKRYGVQTVLVQRTAPLAQVLAEHPAWHLVYHDSVAVLYVRA